MQHAAQAVLTSSQQQQVVKRPSSPGRGQGACAAAGRSRMGHLVARAGSGREALAASAKLGASRLRLWGRFQTLHIDCTQLAAAAELPQPVLTAKPVV